MRKPEFPKPEYTESNGVVKVEYESSAENVTENRESKILDLIGEDNTITTAQIADKLQVARMTIHRDIEKLKAKGLLERIGANKGGYWKVK
ncbi:MAG: DeoR family transcriptional regulator [Bacteroidales bacterium]|nr:DeoR family transcriptional regulator [Bacteroidales bacterium]